MGNTKKQKSKTKIKKLDKKTFARINEKFQQYWKYLFWLIFIYIVCYTVWRLVLTDPAKKFAESRGWNGDNAIFVIILALIQGLLFCLDGVVTALLKSPFNQMCYAINKAEGISDEEKDYIITKATESNEHCKETLKKFGIMMITAELAKTFYVYSKKDSGGSEPPKHGNLMIISYLVPLVFTAVDIWIIHRKLKKIKRLVNSAYGGK